MRRGAASAAASFAERWRWWPWLVAANEVLCCERRSPSSGVSGPTSPAALTRSAAGYSLQRARQRENRQQPLASPPERRGARAIQKRRVGDLARREWDIAPHCLLKQGCERGGGAKAAAMAQLRVTWAGRQDKGPRRCELVLQVKGLVSRAGYCREHERRVPGSMALTPVFGCLRMRVRCRSVVVVGHMHARASEHCKQQNFNASVLLQAARQEGAQCQAAVRGVGSRR